MSNGGFRAAVSALCFFFCIPCLRLSGAPVMLTRPEPAACLAGPQAVYSVVDGALQPVRGQFSIYPPDLQPLLARVGLSLEGTPGQLMKIFLWAGEPLDSVSAQLGTPGKPPLSTSPGFRVSTEGASEKWVVFLGIPASGVPREYTLRLSAAAGRRTFLEVEPFTVNSRRFFSERIPLAAELTSMVTTPDPQKTQEWRALVKLLTTAHPDALFEYGPFIVPLPSARRTSGFGDRREYAYSDGTSGYSIHEGVDIASPEGTPVPACGQGRIVFAGKRILTGNTVVIEHLPGLFSLYDHLSSLAVKANDQVAKGQVLGTVGMTGFATGPHLHWEVQVMGISVDPDALLAAPLLDKSTDFFDIEHAPAPKGGESNSLYRSQ